MAPSVQGMRFAHRIEDFTSTRFQLLPTEIRVDDGGKVSIHSPISNVHPHTYSDLYDTVAEVVECMLPLFEHTLSHLRRVERIEDDHYYSPQYLAMSTFEPM